MRVLWFVPIPLPEVREYLDMPAGGKGWWIAALRDALVQTSQLELGIVYGGLSLSSSTAFVHNGIRYYNFPINKKNYYTQNFADEINQCLEIISNFSPDIIHVHGTEYFYGLISKRTNIPVLISLQGILTKCVHHYFDSFTFLDALRKPQIIRAYLDMLRRSKTEREIIENGHFFAGRTLWDQGAIREINPKAQYYYAPELMRTIFFQNQWHLQNIHRNRIYCTTSGAPYKGIEGLIEAARLLNLMSIDVVLRIGGISRNDTMGRHLWDLVQKAKLTDSITFLGYMTEENIVQELLQAHVYVMPSHIENSSNGLCEAMLVGLPCVASCVGGTMTLLQDGVSGLIFPKGEWSVLALQIKRLLDDNLLASCLSTAAREIAHQRHNATNVTKLYTSIYGRLSINA